MILRLAGVYDEHATVPTMAQQMARIYERDLQSYFYSASTLVGQTMLHREDMLDAFRRTVDRRATGAGNRDPDRRARRSSATTRFRTNSARSFTAPTTGRPSLPSPSPRPVPGSKGGSSRSFPTGSMLARRLHQAVYGRDGRRPLRARHPPRPRSARLGAAASPEGRVTEIVAALKSDPAAWYRRQPCRPPAWLTQADEIGANPDELRARHEAQFESDHRANHWAHFVNIGLAPGFHPAPAHWRRRAAACAGARRCLAPLSSSCGRCTLWRASWARWSAPHRRPGDGGALPFSTQRRRLSLRHARGRVDLRLCDMHKPEPGPRRSPPSPAPAPRRVGATTHRAGRNACRSSRSPSSASTCRAIWPPISWATLMWSGIRFSLARRQIRKTAPKRSSPRGFRAWPVSDAAVGGYTYLLEILTGIVGSRMRWRTMPWLSYCSA